MTIIGRSVFASTPEVYEKPLTPVTVGRVEACETGTSVRLF